MVNYPVKQDEDGKGKTQFSNIASRLDEFALIKKRTKGLGFQLISVKG